MTLQQIVKDYPDEKSAIAFFESIRWPAGVECPHCKSMKKFYEISGKRAGLKQCAACKKQFRVTVGTIFEDSHIPLNTWLIAWFLMCGAKKGMSALQLKRHLWGDKKGSYKTAWFMAHRIRHTMGQLFGNKLSGVVEADETYIGGYQKSGRKGKSTNKSTVVTVVERGGSKRSVVLPASPSGNVSKKAIADFVLENVEPHSTLMTDESNAYRHMRHVYKHHGVKHTSGEYARNEGGMNVNTNTVEGSFSLLKRGIVGSFHHISKKHLPLYLAEFDYRWNTRKATDGERTVEALGKTGGKRLTMRGLVGN